jgi:hypothetical protein
MNRTLVLGFAAAATLFGASAAQAARVDWSIGINVPPVAAVVGPAYVGYPAYYAPPAVYAPRPRFDIEPVPFYAPRPVWFGGDRWREGWRDDRRDDRYGRREGRDHDHDRDHDRDHDHDRHVGWRR